MPLSSSFFLIAATFIRVCNTGVAVAVAGLWMVVASDWLVASGDGGITVALLLTLVVVAFSQLCTDCRGAGPYHACWF